MPENIGNGRKIDAARQVLRKLDKELKAKKSPYNLPDSPEIVQRKQQLENNVKSQIAQQRNYNFEPRTGTTPKTDSAWQDVIDAERRAARTRFEARKAERLGLAEGKTNQTGTTKTTFVRTVPGAEVPHLAVGGSVTGRNFSGKAFGVSAGGAAVGSGVVAAIDFGVQVANGEDPIKAGFKSIGLGLGSFAGGVVGAAVGAAVSIPVLGTGAGVGAVVGSVALGAAGQKAASDLYNLLFGNKGHSLKAIRPKAVKQQTESSSFAGGQEACVLYYVDFDYRRSDGGLEYHFRYRSWGPIGGVRVAYNISGDGDDPTVQILCRGVYDAGDLNCGAEQSWRTVIEGFGVVGLYVNNVSIARVDGQPDTSSNSSPNGTLQPPASQNPIIQLSPYSSPLSSQPEIKGALPPLADKPLETNKRKPVKIQVPQNTRATISQPSNPDGIILTMPTGEVVYELDIPTKPNLQQPNQTPISINNPTDPTTGPTTIITPGLAPIQLNIPGYQPITIDPAGDKQVQSGSRTLFDPRVVQAVPVGQNVPQYTVNAPLFDPKAVQPVPVKPTPITPTTPTTPSAPTTPTEDKPKTPPITLTSFENPDLQQLGLGLATITTILQGLQKNTSPEALRNAAAAGTCQTTQPGGCTSNAMDSAVQKGNKDLLDKLNAGANADQTLMLRVIDAKLGPQLPGGIGTKLKNFVDWAVVDRVVNLVTMVAALHNVFMLTNSISDTFFEAVDNVLAIPALIKNPDADTVDSKQAVTGFLDKYFAQLFGVSEWAALKSQWKAYSTIYSSSAQAFNNLREIHNDSQELLNQSRNYTAQLGNALTDEGIISEDNWDYKDPNQKIKSKGLNKLQRMANGLETVENSLEAIEQITATLRNITETANEIKENVAAIDKAVSNANKAAKADRDAKEEGLELPNFSLEDLS